MYKLNKTKFLLDHEFEALNSTLKKYSDTEFRDTTLLWLLLHTGARAKEILKTRTTDLYPHDGSIYIHADKNSDDRELPLPVWLFARLNKLAASIPPGTSRDAGGFLFPISYWRLRQIWELYRPVPKKLHSTRHTFAMRLYSKTKDIRLVQKALGHRSIGNTMIYSDYAYSQEELRRLML